MFSVGFSEIVMIIFVAFIFVGPKRATEAAYEIGVWVRKIRRQIYDIKQKEIPEWDVSPLYQTKIELNKTLNDLQNQEKPPSTAISDSAETKPL